MKVGGPMILYNGSIAAASATFVGHYPYVLNAISNLHCVSILKAVCVYSRNHHLFTSFDIQM